MDADGLPWRLAERVVALGKTVYQDLRPRRSLGEEWAAIDRGADGWQVEALRIALRGGAVDLAARLAEDVLDRLHCDLIIVKPEGFKAVLSG